MFCPVRSADVVHVPQFSHICPNFSSVCSPEVASVGSPAGSPVGSSSRFFRLAHHLKLPWTLRLARQSVPMMVHQSGLSPVGSPINSPVGSPVGSLVGCYVSSLGGSAIGSKSCSPVGSSRRLPGRFPS
jgi:hypothetical protein